MTAPAARRMPHSAGFTLIELLVVIAILSTVTLLAFDVSTDDRAQLRYNDTRVRLGQLERAILGRLGPVDAASVGGFVADNGELQLRGGTGFLGYWHKPDKTAAMVRDGWFLTGDAVRQTERGELVYLDRVEHLGDE